MRSGGDFKSEKTEKIPAKGVYLLLLYLPQNCSLQMGQKGIIDFPAGYYIYVGRARKNLASRLKRHLSPPKNLYWHIDYFRQRAQLNGIWLKRPTPLNDLKTEECFLAEKIRHHSSFLLPQLKKLGASDCGCPGHFIYLGINQQEIISFLSQVKYLRRINYGIYL
jgi:sugar fermentation stimulation protein A